MRVVIGKQIRADHDQVRRLIREGFRGMPTRDVEVHVRASWQKSWDGVQGSAVKRVPGTFSGYAYQDVPSIAKVKAGTRYLVTIRMPADPAHLAVTDSYPRISGYYFEMKTAPRIEVHDWTEHLVTVAAHEGYHIKQFVKGWRCSEVDADVHARRRLREWRQEQDRQGE